MTLTSRKSLLGLVLPNSEQLQNNSRLDGNAVAIITNSRVTLFLLRLAIKKHGADMLIRLRKAAKAVM